MTSKPTERFSNRVENYIKYRPGYPAAIIDFLAAKCNLTPTTVIADVGFGTGLLAKLFLENGNKVLGLEPNPDMRTAGATLLENYPAFTPIAATAEATTLPDHSVDFVIAGQAFHWFQPQESYQEFTRILKPQGWVALVWNKRQTDTPFMAVYEQMLAHYGTDYKALHHHRLDDNEMMAIFGPELKHKTFDNYQHFNFEGLKGRLLSSSYAPLAGHPNHTAMLNGLKEIFDTYQKNDSVTFQYKTNIYYCQLK